MKIKTFLLPIWWYNRGLFPLGNKYRGVFILNGLTIETCSTNTVLTVIKLNSSSSQRCRVSGCPQEFYHWVMYIALSSGHIFLNLNLPSKLILRRFEVVFWCLEWEWCTFWKIDGIHQIYQYYMYTMALKSIIKSKVIHVQVHYCISCYFREGFIFANFASQTLAKISTSIHVYL